MSRRLSGVGYDLPRWPSGGDRRRLDESWIRTVERDGLSTYVARIPAGPPTELGTSVELFNTGDFWAANMELHPVWRRTSYPSRLFYHALIKVAASFHQIVRHNRHGAQTRLSDARRLLRLFPPEFQGVNIDRLLRDVESWLSTMEASGRVDWARIDMLPKPKVQQLF